jgi:hypothetical protein
MLDAVTKIVVGSGAGSPPRRRIYLARTARSPASPPSQAAEREACRGPNIPLELLDTGHAVAGYYFILGFRYLSLRLHRGLRSLRTSDGSSLVLFAIRALDRFSMVNGLRGSAYLSRPVSPPEDPEKDSRPDVSMVHNASSISTTYTKNNRSRVPISPPWP